MVRNATTGDVFKRAFNEILAGKHFVALFDHAWSTMHGSGYHSTVYKYSVAAGYVPMEFEGRQVSENSLVKNICLPSTKSHPDLSSFRRLSAAMEERTSGLIIIHNAHHLSDKATHLLSRLATFVKGKKLDWKIILFADVSALKQLNIAQLSIDQSFPESFLELDWGTDASPDIKRTDLKIDGAGNSIKYAICAIFGLLALAIGLKLIY